MIEFAYNSSVSRSTRCGPFEILTGMLPRKPINLIPLPLVARLSAKAESFRTHIHAINDDIWGKIVPSKNFKAYAYLKRKFAKFNEGDILMVCVKA